MKVWSLPKRPDDHQSQPGDKYRHPEARMFLEDHIEVNLLRRCGGEDESYRYKKDSHGSKDFGTGRASHCISPTANGKKNGPETHDRL
eukprot:CAMPEP_0170616648 /NCGR_PEP_ID=MMETSP0224-20130122/25980_1 /TAXON_ID=285029 /ORGANISM="Togula jolla, Strain CCCM 725" /LENGTH=87 /DNA_ID=CAMNT_0010942455 /DNA_START=387 /DNA_END=650 /DNA_ORIENTATION=-